MSRPHVKRLKLTVHGGNTFEENPPMPQGRRIKLKAARSTHGFVLVLPPFPEPGDKVNWEGREWTVTASTPAEIVARIPIHRKHSEHEENPMPHKPLSVKQQIEACRKWNESHPIGTPVTVELDSGEIRATKTRSEAQMLGARPSWNEPGHTAIIWLEHMGACVLLSRVRAKGEAHHAG
jgi:hypothetical protein